MSRATIKDKRRAELIGAALDSIAKRGLQETTITHISTGAGLSRGIVNFYFTSKEIMLRETLKTLLDAYEREWRNAIAPFQQDGQALVEALIAVHFNKRLCSPKRLNIMTAFWGHAASHSAYRQQLETADALLETELARGLSVMLGGSAEEAGNAARQLHAMIRGFWLSFMLNPSEDLRLQLMGQCQQFLDRLTGAPIRIVMSAPAPAMEMVVNHDAPKPGRKSRASAEKPAASEQMDIEDLFSRLL